MNVSAETQLEPDIETYSANSSALIQAICYKNALVNKIKSQQLKSSSENIKEFESEESSALGILDN